MDMTTGKKDNLEECIAVFFFKRENPNMSVQDFGAICQVFTEDV